MSTFQMVVCLCILIVLYCFGKAMRTRMQYRAGHLSPSPGPVATPPAGTAPAATIQRWVPLRVKTHPWWTAIIILLCLALLPEIVAVGKSIATKVWEGPASVFRGTPRSEWAIGSQSAQPVALQGKSVGGPLRWSDNAKVTVRDQTMTENPDKGRYFGGIVPPESKVRFDIGLLSVTGSREYYLVNRTTLGSIPPLSILREGSAKCDDGKRGCVFSLEKILKELTQGGDITNLAHPPALAEYYIQSDPDQSAKVLIKRNEASGVFQYVLEVGADPVTVTVPESCSFFWISPVHHRDYQSKLNGTPVPASGVSINDAADLIQISSDRFLKKLQKDTEYSYPILYQAIVLVEGTESKALDSSVLWPGSAVSGKTLTLRLNVSSVPGLSVMAKPAKVIVGLKL